MKKILALFLTLIVGVSSFSMMACSSGTSDKGFKEGYAVNFEVLESIEISDLVDNKGAAFELTATKEGEEPVDLSNENKWKIPMVGEWVLNLKILNGENKGDYSITINVRGEPLTIDFKSKGLRYKPNEVVAFEDIIEDLEIETNFEGYGSYTKRIYSIQLVGLNTEIVKFDKNATSYTFPEKGNYTIIFGVEAEDGQLKKDIVEVTVR